MTLPDGHVYRPGQPVPWPAFVELVYVSLPLHGGITPGDVAGLLHARGADVRHALALLALEHRAGEEHDGQWLRLPGRGRG